MKKKSLDYRKVLILGSVTIIFLSILELALMILLKNVIKTVAITEISNSQLYVLLLFTCLLVWVIISQLPNVLFDFINRTKEAYNKLKK